MSNDRQAPRQPPRLDDLRPGLDAAPAHPTHRAQQPYPAYRPSENAGGAPPLPPGHPLTLRPAPRQGARPSPEHSLAREPSRRGRFVSILVPAVLTVAAVLAAVAVYLVLFPPVDYLRARAIAEVKARTGRTLTISGPVSLQVYPVPTLRIADVSLSGPPGMAATAPLATANYIEARLKLWPLLQRQLGLEQLVLREPVFDLRIDKDGRRNWDFRRIELADAKAATSAGKDGLPQAVRDFVEHASNPDAPSPQTRLKLAMIEDLAPSDIRIERGALTYTDDRSGLREQVSGLDAVVSLPSLGAQLEATGSMTWSGQQLGFDAKLTSPRALLEDRPAGLRLALKAATVDARFEGTALVRSTLEIEGHVAAKGPSLRALTQWLGTELPPCDGFGPHAVDGSLRLGPRGLQISDATFSLDGMQATGTFAVDTSAARPKVTGNLRAGVLDLNRYTLASGKAVAARPRQPAASPARATPARSIEDLLREGAAEQPAAPRVKGYTAREGWSSEPIRLDALSLADADVRIGVEGLRWREIKTENAVVTVALKSNVLRVDLDEVRLYEGKGRGVVTIDANAAPPTLGVNLTVDGVAGRPLLQDAAGFDLLSGNARIQLALGMQGMSELALVESMSGKADLQFANGAVTGFNLAGALRALKSGQVPNLSRAPTEKTDFSEMRATFQIQNGIATNQDLKLMSPFLRVGGAGQIALPARTIDYTLKPKLVSTAEGQAARDSADKLVGVEVPVRVRGPLSDPDVKPDYDALLKDPGKAVEAVKEIGKQLKGSGFFKSLIGKPQGAAPPPSGESAPDGAGEKASPAVEKAKKLLEGVLGR